MEISIREYLATDEPLIKEISHNCGSKSVKDGYNYIRKIRHLQPSLCRGKIINDCGFYFAISNKRSYRIIEFSILKSMQGRGLGNALFDYLKKQAISEGKGKITLRTSKYESAINFWEHVGARVIGCKDDDYEMEIIL